MEGILLNLLVAVIVFAIIAAVIKGLESGGYLDATLARIGMLIVGGIFLIYVLVQVLFPLMHTAPVTGALPDSLAITRQAA